MFGDVLAGEWIELRDFVLCRAFLTDFAKRYPSGATVNLQLESDIDETFASLVGRQPIGESAIILAALIMGFKVSLLGAGMLRVELPR